MSILLLLVIILPFIGFICTNIANHLFPLRRGLVTFIPTTLLFINVIISLYLFYTVAFMHYNNTVLTNQAHLKSDASYYTSAPFSLDLGT